MDHHVQDDERQHEEQTSPLIEEKQTLTKAQAGALAAGPDGRIWFIRLDTSSTDMSGNFWWTQIGCMTP